MLTLTGDDPLNTDSWTKNPKPVFQRADQNRVFGPGHNGFFKSPDGTEDWIVYHGNDQPSDGCDGARMTRVQKINWNADGTPDFGIPLPDDQPIAAPSGDMGIDPLPEFPPLDLARFKSVGLDAYIRHVNFQIAYNASVVPLADSQFIVIPGLADPEAVSLQSSNFPSFYIRQMNNAVTLSGFDNTENFNADATWWIRPGLSDERLVSLESFSQPGFYIARKFGVPALSELTDALSTKDREIATFTEEK